MLRLCKARKELLRETRGCEHMVQLVEELDAAHDATELAEHGSLIDLQDTLDFEGRRPSRAITLRWIILQVQKALNAIWDLGIVHADVRRRNVLVFRYNEMQTIRS